MVWDMLSLAGSVVTPGHLLAQLHTCQPLKLFLGVAEGKKSVLKLWC